MTAKMFQMDAYLAEIPGQIASITDTGGIVLDRTVFYPTGGGQPGDSGVLSTPEGEITITEAVNSGDSDIVLIPADNAIKLEPMTKVMQSLDWERRLAHMRMHTALHLLSVVIPLPVTGGAITAEKGRLDFDMPEAPEDKDALEAELNSLIAANHPVSDTWISDEELAANPGLVKTMSVKPPVGAGQVRLIQIGTDEARVDLQPCGGTHVAATAEIGPVRLGKIEKKGKQNRRVSVHFVD